jgi:hypothetical protein
LVALAAIKRHAERGSTPFMRLGPGAVEPWRIVADMLVVTACKFGNPILGVIQMESDDRLLHCSCAA